MSMKPLKAVLQKLERRAESSRQAALEEVRELRRELADLERYLSGKRKSTAVVTEDILRSAFDIHHHTDTFTELGSHAATMAADYRDEEAVEYLLSRGARQLKKDGWLWTSSKEQTYVLDREGDPVKAEKKLRKLLASGKRR